MRPEAVQTPIKIFLTMLDADRPLRPADISQLTGLSRQVISYHVPNMVKDGLVVPLEINGQNYFSVQMVFLNNALFKKLSDGIMPIIRVIGDNVSYEYTDNGKEDVIRNCLIAYIVAITRKL